MKRARPCTVDPGSWDHDPGRGPHPPVAVLVDRCRTQCPALDRCATLPHEGVYGVVAGEYRPWPRDPRLLMVNEKLARTRVAEMLREHLAKYLKPGDKIPEAEELARWGGVDITTARSAIRLLAKEKLLKHATTHGCPWVVAKTPPRKRTESAA